ncbi:MAG: 50S ribosomal protein L5 [Candidatus Paceibacterota bacterium]
MESIKQKQENAYDALKDAFSLTNRMESPRLEKIVINVGTGSVKDKEKVEVIEDRLRRITGQQPVRTVAKQSIAAFTLREGSPVGYQVTLRGDRMYNFLDKLVHLAMPRMKDFHGISTKPIDAMGNYTLGIREHTIFPETSDEDLKNVFGMAITVVTSTSDRAAAEAFFRHLGFPFQKEEATEAA